MGGVRAIIVALRSDITVGPAGAAQITLAIAAGEGLRLPFRGSFQSVAQVDESTGQKYFRDELAGFIPATNIDEAKDLHFFASAGPDDIVILVETWNGTYYAIGYGWRDAGRSEVIATSVFFNGGQLFTGTEKSDGNGWAVNLVSVHPFPAALCYEPDPEEISNPSTD